MDENQQAAQQKGTNPLLVVGIIVIIGVVAGAFWLISGNQNKVAQSTQTTTQTDQTQQTTQEQQAPDVTGSVTETMVSNEISVEGGNFYFKPNEIRVKKGEKVIITLTSKGGIHNFVIDEFNVASDTVNGESTTVEFTPDKIGTFEFYCSIGAHRQMGMKGKLIVE